MVKDINTQERRDTYMKTILKNIAFHFIENSS